MLTTEAVAAYRTYALDIAAQAIDLEILLAQATDALESDVSYVAELRDQMRRARYPRREIAQALTRKIARLREALDEVEAEISNYRKARHAMVKDCIAPPG